MVFIIIQKRRKKVTPKKKIGLKIDKKKIREEYRKYAKRTQKNMFG